MSRYELSRDRRITIAAIILEVLMLIACVLLADSINAEFFKVQTLLAEHVPMMASLIIVIVLQYMIAGTEMIARYRTDSRGFTLPLVFVPGGIVLRTLILFICNAAVILLKMAVYFMSIVFEFVFQILHIGRYIGTASLVDLTDKLLEPLEIGVNHVYNFLYYNKINTNSSVFTSAFNSTLSFWCINH